MEVVINCLLDLVRSFAHIEWLRHPKMLSITTRPFFNLSLHFSTDPLASALPSVAALVQLFQQLKGCERISHWVDKVQRVGSRERGFAGCIHPIWVEWQIRRHLHVRVDGWIGRIGLLLLVQKRHVVLRSHFYGDTVSRGVCVRPPSLRERSEMGTFGLYAFQNAGFCISLGCVTFTPRQCAPFAFLTNGGELSVTYNTLSMHP